MKSGQRWVGWGGRRWGSPGVGPCMREHSPPLPRRPPARRPLRLPALASHRPLSLATSVPDLARSGGPRGGGSGTGSPLTPRWTTDPYAERTDGCFFVFYTLTLKESLSLQEGETEERSSLTRQMAFLFLCYLPGEPNQETDISTHCFESFFFLFFKYPDVFV